MDAKPAETAATVDEDGEEVPVVNSAENAVVKVRTSCIAQVAFKNN